MDRRIHYDWSLPKPTPEQLRAKEFLLQYFFVQSKGLITHNYYRSITKKLPHPEKGADHHVTFTKVPLHVWKVTTKDSKKKNYIDQIPKVCDLGDPIYGNHPDGLANGKVHGKN